MLAAPKMATELRCALDPVAFAEERLNFCPDPWQAKVMRSPAKRVLLNCSRQAGKSTTTAIIGLHRASTVHALWCCLFRRLCAKVESCLSRCRTS